MENVLYEWMKYLPDDVRQKPLCQVKIPGSHDSFADESLSEHLPVANDETKTIALAGKIPYIRKGIKRWAITQHLTIRKQLEAGIRYLDLRVSRPPEDVRERYGDYGLVHALYGNLLHDTLKEVAEFCEENPTEVVLLHLNQIYGIDGSESMKALAETVGSILKWEHMCPSMNPSECTYNFMQKNGFRYIVFVCRPCDNRFWDHPCQLYSFWPRTNKTHTLIDFLEKRLIHDRTRCSNSFYVSQGVLTAELGNVIRHWFSTLADVLSLSAKRAVLDWISTTEYHGLLNIVIADVVDEDFSSNVIKLNYGSKYDKNKSVDSCYET